MFVVGVVIIILLLLFVFDIFCRPVAMCVAGACHYSCLVLLCVTFCMRLSLFAVCVAGFSCS